MKPAKTPLAIARLSKGLLQKELAYEIGCTVRHLQFVESGQRKSVSLCKKAETILGVKI